MVWITRFTLLAYLVGGWLLPASHFHAHSVVAGQGVVLCGGHHHSSDAAHVHGHSHDQPADDSDSDVRSSNDGAEHHGCGGSADSAIPDSGCVQLSAGEDGWLSPRGVSDRCHSGLCVVCVAQTMVSIVTVDGCVQARLAPPLPCPAFTERSLYLSPLRGSDSSRGPPKMA